MNSRKTLEEFGISKGHFVALSPKCYFTYDANSEEIKKGTKGVPHSCDLVIDNFLNKLYGRTDHSVELSKTLNFASLDQILTSEEIENIPPAWLPNLRSRILEPKHSRPVIQV